MNYIERSVNECEAAVDNVETLRRIQDLNEARQLVVETRYKIVKGPTFPWSILNNAESYLDRQITELYKNYFAEVAQ